ncbi:MAG: DUF362 domain-containing protein [Candidatus Hodarchaeota archaeon]
MLYDRIMPKSLVREGEDWYEPSVEPLTVSVELTYKVKVLGAGEIPVYVVRGNLGDLIVTSYVLVRDVFKTLIERENLQTSIRGGKVLVKPNCTLPPGLFVMNENTKRLMEINNISQESNYQTVDTPASVLQATVDVLLEYDPEEVAVGESVIWPGGTKRAFYELGYSKIFSHPKYSKVTFVDLHQSEYIELEEKPDPKKLSYEIEEAATRTEIPRALFDENWSLIVNLPGLKTHTNALYTLSLKGFSISFLKPKTRYRIHGIPEESFMQFDQKRSIESISEREEISREEQKHFQIQKVGKTKIVIEGSGSTTLPVTTYTHFNQALLHVDPLQKKGSYLGLLALSAAYLSTRYMVIASQIIKKLIKKGTKFVSLIYGTHAMDGEGPLIHGKSRRLNVAIAGMDPIATERIALEVMFSESEKLTGIKLSELMYKFYQRYNVFNDELLDEVSDLWTLKLGNELGIGEYRLEHIRTIILDAEGGEITNFADLRSGEKPFEIPLIFRENGCWGSIGNIEELFLGEKSPLSFHALDPVDVIEIPMTPETAKEKEE